MLNRKTAQKNVIKSMKRNWLIASNKGLVQIFSHALYLHEWPYSILWGLWATRRPRLTVITRLYTYAQIDARFMTSWTVFYIMGSMSHTQATTYNYSKTLYICSNKSTFYDFMNGIYIMGQWATRRPQLTIITRLYTYSQIDARFISSWTVFYIMGSPVHGL